jgi:transcriptional regulator GlxA family with amidase domain
LRVTQLAQISGLSVRGFHLAFREHLGQSPGTLLQRLRLDRAKGLLADSDLPMVEVARKSGYRSINTFYIAFRNAFGLTPRRFRDLFRTHVPFRALKVP